MMELFATALDAVLNDTLFCIIFISFYWRWWHIAYKRGNVSYDTGCLFHENIGWNLCVLCAVPGIGRGVTRRLFCAFLYA